MRIQVVNPYSGTEGYGRENLSAIASSDTSFEFVDLRERYPLRNNQWLYFRHSCTAPTIDRAIEAERNGFDAVFISCNLDIGLYECRQMCTIPVTATLESAVLVAHMMGRRFSLLSVDDQNGQIQKMLLERYQLDKGLVSVRAFDIDADDLFLDRNDAAAVRDHIVEVGRRAIEEDGAEVLVSGCTHAGSILSHYARQSPEALPAPIIDGMLTGFKLAETMATLHAAGLGPVSRLGMFEQPPVSQLAELRAAQGQPMPPWAERATSDQEQA